MITLLEGEDGFYVLDMGVEAKPSRGVVSPSLEVVPRFDR